MGERVTSVAFDAPAKPINGLAVCADAQLAQPNKHVPEIGARIMRRQPECFLDMFLDLFTTTQQKLAKSDESMRIGQIRIQQECLSAFGDATQRAPGLHLNGAEQHVGSRVIGRMKQDLMQCGLCGFELHGWVIGQES